MIYAHTVDAGRYAGLCPALDAALQSILAGDYLGLTPGERKALAPDGSAYLSCFAYETVPEEGSLFEAHEHWGDIHIILDGAERVNVARPDALTVVERRPENDYIALSGRGETCVVLRPGSFLAVFPEDAHQIKLCLDEPESVVKTVYKFRLSPAE